MPLFKLPRPTYALCLVSFIVHQKVKLSDVCLKNKTKKMLFLDISEKMAFWHWLSAVFNCMICFLCRKLVRICRHHCQVECPLCVSLLSFYLLPLVGVFDLLCQIVKTTERGSTQKMASLVWSVLSLLFFFLPSRSFLSVLSLPLPSPDRSWRVVSTGRPPHLFSVRLGPTWPEQTRTPVCV